MMCLSARWRSPISRSCQDGWLLQGLIHANSSAIIPLRARWGMCGTWHINHKSGSLMIASSCYNVLFRRLGQYHALGPLDFSRVWRWCSRSMMEREHQVKFSWNVSIYGRKIHDISDLYRSKPIAYQLAWKISQIKSVAMNPCIVFEGNYVWVCAKIEVAKVLTRFTPLNLNGRERIFFLVKYEKLGYLLCEVCGVLGHN